ncbi:unnamed protein product [Prorocentrum cordatum]|uniref:Carboxypeptidase regulatory-like domain-containing protein n=1 Tax=Prorocentrum cordatum TaxID=2364126 RepID=A0ABN9TWT9_9DINO|nr:unnamed protein product [Polarella glacialis]
MGAMSSVSPPPPAPAPPEKPRAKFRGQVVDLSGQAVPDVSVNWGRGGCFAGCEVTDEDGCFMGDISDAETEVPDDAASGGSTASTSTMFSFTREGFAPTSAASPCQGGGPETVLRVALRPISATAVLDAAVGGQLVDPASGSSVSFPPGVLVQQDGSPVVGPVTVSLSVIDATDPAALASMPGDFSAVDENGCACYLQSLGAMWVGAQDGSGADLAIKEGAAGVTVDLKSSATADMGKLGVGAEMWSFDEASGKWQQETSTPLKIDGRTAPNSAASSATVMGDSDEDLRPKGGIKTQKKGGKMRRGVAYEASGSATAKACMSPEDFAQIVKKPGPKTLSTNITKLGYINCDLMYHHPQRAVMLQGRMLTEQREPLAGVQLWCVGRDYGGRTPDVTDADGKFKAMVAQFDSTVDIEVSIPKPLPNDDVIEVCFDHLEWYRRLPKGSVTKKLDAVPGKYLKGAPVDGQPAWYPKQRKTRNDEPSMGPVVKIIWCQTRHQWRHLVDDLVVFCKEGSESPVGSGWRVAPTFQAELVGQSCSTDPIGVPTYSRAVRIEKMTVGPFQTGPPGEFVDVGESLVPQPITPILSCASSPM